MKVLWSQWYTGTMETGQTNSRIDITFQTLTSEGLPTSSRQIGETEDHYRCKGWRCDRYDLGPSLQSVKGMGFVPDL